MATTLLDTVNFSYTTISPAFSATYSVELYVSTAVGQPNEYYGYIYWVSGSTVNVDVHAVWHAFADALPTLNSSLTSGQISAFGALHGAARYYSDGTTADVINAGNTGGGIYTLGGADIINATVKPGQVQGGDGGHDGGHTEWHIYGGRGNDTINMDFSGVTVAWSMGHHAQGDLKEESETVDQLFNDNFNFKNLASVGAGEVVVGRLDDFDATRDRISIEGISITNLNSPPALPAGVSYKIVRHIGELDAGAATEAQQWIVITTQNGGKIVYALESDRIRMNYNGSGRTDEPHFVTLTTANAIIASAATTFVDPQNYVPDGETVEAGGLFINDADGSIADVNTAIAGTAFGDRIAAGVNNDSVNANGGNDKVWGGGGTDTIKGGTGHDTVLGGFGNDSIYGETGNDSLLGEVGNDNLYGGDGTDLLYGGDGTDILDGGVGADAFYGGSGTDTASYATATAAVRADLTTPSTNTGVAAGDSYSSIENLAGSAYADTLKGNASNNTLTGNNGDDLLAGEAGNDVLYGGAGNDDLYGGTGLDTLFGSDGFDLIMGSDGNDTLDGGTGNDTMLGQSGADRLTGGAGDDLFRYQSADQGGDTITDFTNVTGNNDRFSIDASGFGGGLSGGSLLASQFLLRTTNSHAATSTAQRFIYNSVANTLWFDADGTGASAAVLIATLQSSAPDLTIDDIWLFS